MPDELLDRLRRFHDGALPQYREQFQTRVDERQHPATMLIGCSDSRLMPYPLNAAGPGELSLVCNVRAFVPPHDGSHDDHGTTAAIELAVLNVQVSRVVVCGHSHCGAIKAMYGEISPDAPNLNRWLDLGSEAQLPIEAGPGGCGVPSSALWCCNWSASWSAPWYVAGCSPDRSACMAGTM